MTDLKKHVVQFIRGKVADKTMELLAGLNEKNHRELYCITEKSSKKLVKAYLSAIKKQNKQAKKKKNKKPFVITTNSPVAFPEPVSIAS
jgi:hypothetical protein